MVIGQPQRNNMEVSENRGTPKSSIFVWDVPWNKPFFNHPDPSSYGDTHFRKPSYHHLVGGFNLPLWKMMDNSSVGVMTFLFVESHNPVMFQTTNQNQSSNINDINQVVFPTIFRCRSMVETHEKHIFSGKTPSQQPATAQPLAAPASRHRRTHRAETRSAPGWDRRDSPPPEKGPHLIMSIYIYVVIYSDI